MAPFLICEARDIGSLKAIDELCANMSRIVSILEEFAVLLDSRDSECVCLGSNRYDEVIVLKVKDVGDSAFDIRTRIT